MTVIQPVVRGKMILPQCKKMLDVCNRFYMVEAGNLTGLGVAIAKDLMNRMDGKIEAVYSEKKLRIRVAFPEWV